MKVRLNSLKDGKQEITATLDARDIDIIEPDLSSPVTVSLKIDRGAKEIKIDGQVETTARLECDRCLNSFLQPISGTFNVIASFSNPDSELNDDNIIPLSPTTNEIDLTGYVHDTLLLEMPMKILCREDCRGLCPVCGVNRNEIDCRCNPTDPDARWESLKEITLNVMEDK